MTTTAARKASPCLYTGALDAESLRHTVPGQCCAVESSTSTAWTTAGQHSVQGSGAEYGMCTGALACLPVHLRSMLILPVYPCARCTAPM